MDNISFFKKKVQNDMQYDCYLTPDSASFFAYFVKHENIHKKVKKQQQQKQQVGCAQTPGKSQFSFSKIKRHHG